MDLELSEVFVCPDCRPAQGLVVLVEEMDARRVLSGSLGCPGCGLRVPVREGVVRFDALEPAGISSPAPLRDRLGGEPGTVAAALLGVGNVEGPFLLGPGLAEAASRVADLAEGADVLVLEREAGGGGGDGAPSTRVRGVDAGNLPLLSGKFGGVALLAPSAGAVGEGYRVLRSGGRLVVLLPQGEPALHLPEGGFEVLASDGRAWVAARSG